MNKRMIIIIGGALLITAALIILFNPSHKKNNKRTDVRQNPPVTQQNPVMKMTVYYPNPEYIKTGNDQVKRVIPVERGIKKGNIAQQVKSAMDNLSVPPKGGETALKNLKVLGTRVNGDTAYVNFSSDQLYGGSLEETLLIEQVVRTLTGLPGIKRVQFLIDGELGETLMGHYGIESALTVDNL